jgi:hypothetical protein
MWPGQDSNLRATDYECVYRGAMARALGFGLPEAGWSALRIAWFGTRIGHERGVSEPPALARYRSYPRPSACARWRCASSPSGSVIGLPSYLRRDPQRLRRRAVEGVRRR